MKKSLIICLLLLFLLTFSTLNTAFGLLTVSSPTQTFGFQNGSYIGFADSITFVTAVDGGGTQMISSSNASYPNFMFFQKQGSNDVYGFWASGVNVTVNSYFSSNILEMACVGAGTVKVQVGPYGAPVSISGASGVYDPTLKVSIITVTSSVTVQLVWGVAPTPPPGGGGGGGDATPTPAPTISPTLNPTGYPTVAPTLPPLGASDFQVSNLDLGVIQPNSTITANLHFRFSGSSYTLQAISFAEPFNSWYVPDGNFATLIYILNVNGESSGDAVLSFAIDNSTAQSYSGSFSVTAKDAFGAVHTSTGTINAEVSASSRFDVVAFFKLHPLYIVLLAIVIGVLLVALVLRSKRRR